ncbi:MAG: hypothetical protein PHX62_08240, partial [Bacilli bacterium]|nr:hypothetical protein [Bacilli bacterium]
TEGLSSVEELDADSALWNTYQEKMQGIADEYFSVTGIHILISVNDEAGSPTDPKNWTSYQTQLAEELYAEIWKYYEAEPGTPAEKFSQIADLFTKAPRFLAGMGQDVASQPEGFDYVVETEDYKFEFSKYKTAGLTLVYQDLGSFGPGQMVEAFEDAVREMWNANPESQSPTPRKEAIITEFGYHGYVNLNSSDIGKWYYSSDEDETNPGIIPTLQMIKTYLADSESTHLLDDEGEKTEEEFTDAMETAITTYFTPVYQEASNSYYVTIKLYEELKNLGFTFNSSNYTEAQFNEFIQRRIKSYQSNLEYFAIEE